MGPANEQRERAGQQVEAKTRVRRALLEASRVLSLDEILEVFAACPIEEVRWRAPEPPPPLPRGRD